MISTRTIGLAAALLTGALLAAGAQAGDPRFENLVLSDAKGGAAKKSFTPATPKIFLSGRLAEVPSGSKIKCAWVAEKTKVAPPNYQIDATEHTGGGAMNLANFSMSKPTAGWPVGAYRADLFINGKPAGNVRFSVAP